MRPEHLGALQPTVLSFTRSLVRRMVRERWRITRAEFNLDEHGAGKALYRVETGVQSFDFVVFSFKPTDGARRTDRIIGRHWDMLGALVEGEASGDRITQTRRELPKLYEGRAPEGTLIWCRSNRSLRIFDHVVERLAAGAQPDVPTLAEVCYIMRNTGLDGNGTFGTRSFLSYGPDHALSTPYHAQMLAAFLMREFSFDLADHIAACRTRNAASLDNAIKRFLGLGNASGLGLVLFTVNHPVLVHRWLELRERALLNSLDQIVAPDSPEVETLTRLLTRVVTYRSQDRIRYSVFQQSARIAHELSLVQTFVHEFARDGTVSGKRPLTPWRAIRDTVAKRVGRETLETFHALLVDLYPDFADSINHEHVTGEALEPSPEMTVAELRMILKRHFAWCFELDMGGSDARKYFWYKSAEAEEPRRGIRGEVTGFDLAVDLPGGVQALDRDLRRAAPREDIATVLTLYPEHRAIVDRVQVLHGLAFHAPRMNMLNDRLVPVHIIRLVNASFYGLDKTKDVERSLGRWLRGVLFHGAPTAADIARGAHPGWPYPEEPHI